MLEEVKGKRRFTWILLSQNAQVAELRNGVMVLAMANVGARDSFSRGGSEDVLREALVVVLGRRLQDRDAWWRAGPARPPRPPGRRPVDQQAAASWDAPAPGARRRSDPGARAAARRAGPVRDRGSSCASRSAPPGRAPAVASTDDERDAAATRNDSDLEDSAESHTELLARHLGAEIIAEETERA